MRPDKYTLREDAVIHPEIARMVEDGILLSPETQDWLSGGHRVSDWDEDIRRNLLSCIPILPLVFIQRQMDQVRAMMDNVLQHAELTGNPNLHTEVERTWTLLQEELDRLVRHVYLAGFSEQSEMFAMMAMEQTRSVFKKFKVLFSTQRANLHRMEENLLEYLGGFVQEPPFTEQ